MAKNDKRDPKSGSDADTVGGSATAASRHGDVPVDSNSIYFGISSGDREVLWRALSNAIADTPPPYLQPHDFHGDVEDPMFNTFA